MIWTDKEKRIAQSPETQIGPAGAQEIFAKRKAMLFSLKGDISTALQDLLSKKIEYEHAYVLESGTLRTKALAAQQRLNATLRSEYFIQKTLDMSEL